MVSTGDTLTDPDALVRFLDTHDVHPDALTGGRQPTAEDLAAVRALRQALRELIDEPDATDAAASAGILTVRAGIGPTLRRDGDGRWQ